MFTFLTSADQVAFVRSDAEQADWTQEEMSLRCVFPYDPNKVLTRGMRMLFQDPATGDWKAYEIRQCTIYPDESYQQITAEDIAISELTDCHIGTKIELSNVTAGAALGQILTGTGWSVGTNTASGTSSGDIRRGSVWDGVSTIQTNWNVYIMPRVTVSASGITAKYLDVLPAEGVWRGLRLSVDKNVTDPCVTYDDTGVYTALYGYGGTLSSNGTSTEVDFASQVWSQTSSHPAKPSGQKYLEWPEKTALYGRNGRARFGYYQNTSIKDGAVLLQKTWEMLKTCCDPKVSITGTVADLKRLGYADQPMRLHDMAIIDLQPSGGVLYKQIIQLTVNLLDPTDCHPTIGDYIPNIIYINRETVSYATGGGTGVGGGLGSTLSDSWHSSFEGYTHDTDYEIGELQSDVAQNTQDIASNTQDIATNTQDISTNAQNIATNTQNIATNTNDISVNAHDISVNAHDISVNAQDISVVAQDVSVQAQTISLVSEKADHNGDILAAAGISINSSGVAVYAQDYSTNLGSILTVQSNKIGMVVGEYQGTNYVKAAEI